MRIDDPKLSIHSLKLLIANSPLAVYLSDYDGKIIMVNKEAILMTGFSEKELLNKTIMELDSVYKDIHHCRLLWDELTPTTKKTINTHHICKNGDLIDVELHVTLIELNNKKYLLGNVLDKTSQNTIERELKESQLRMKEAQNIAQIGNWQIDYKTNALIWSDEIYRIFELDKSVKLSLDLFYSLVYPDDREALQNSFNFSVQNKKEYSFIHRILLKNNNVKTVHERARTYYDSVGNPIQTVGTVQDISEKVLNERRLEEYSEMMYKLTRQVPGVVYQYQLFPDGRSCFPYSSPGMMEIYGFTPDEVKEDASPVFGRLHPEDHDRVASDIFKSADNLSLFTCEFRVIMPEKGVQWRMSNARPERMNDGSTLWYGIITDTTEQKRNEEALFSSEKRYKLLIENSSDIIVLLNNIGEQTMVSKVAEAITGFSPTELVGKKIQEVIHPDDFKATDEIFQKVLKNPSKSFRAQYRHIHKTKKWVWLEFSAQNFLHDPAFNAIMLTVRDISINKENETQLRKLSLAVEQSSSSIVITDLDGNIEYVNPRFLQITGYSAKELIGKNPKILKSGAQPKEYYNNMWTTVKNGDTWTGQFLNKKKNGEFYWESAAISPIKNEKGEITHILGIKEDITERKHHEEKLRLSEEKYKIVADNTYNWEFWENTKGELVYVSPSCEMITGYTSHELVENAQLMKKLIHPDDLDSYLMHRKETFVKWGSHKCEFRIVDKWGEIKHIGHICQPAFDSSGNFLGIRGTNVDITDKVIQIEKIQNLLKIEEEQNKRLLNFTHIVSHNLRSHTANMQGILSLLEYEKPEMFKHEYIEMMKQSAENLNETISHLNMVLDVTKAQNEKWNKINLATVIKRTFESISILAKNANVELINEVSPEISMPVIPAYLDSIVLNLLTNAIKFSSPDKESFARVYCEIIENNKLKIVFEDNGLGIDLERYRAKLFRMYNTFHKHKDSKGLGLFITKNQVEAMGGEIDVESKPNEGTKFYVILNR